MGTSFIDHNFVCYPHTRKWGFVTESKISHNQSPVNEFPEGALDMRFISS